VSVRFAEGEAQLMRFECTREKHGHQVGDRVRLCPARICDLLAAFVMMGSQFSAARMQALEGNLMSRENKCVSGDLVSDSAQRP
jgi:hypothetical protein